MPGAEGGIGFGIFVAERILRRRTGVIKRLVEFQRRLVGIRVDRDVAAGVHPVAAIGARQGLEHHHVEEKVIHLQHGAIADRALAVDLLAEIERSRRPIVPCPVIGLLGRKLLAEILLGDLGILGLGVGIGDQRVDEILAVVHEMQRQIGRHAILLAVELHRLQDGIAEHLRGVGIKLDRLHIGRIATDRIGCDQIDVEGIGAGRHIGLQLVEEAVAVEEQKFDLVGIRRRLVVKIGGGAQRRFLGTSRPAEDDDLGVGKARQRCC